MLNHVEAKQAFPSGGIDPWPAHRGLPVGPGGAAVRAGQAGTQLGLSDPALSRGAAGLQPPHGAANGARRRSPCTTARRARAAHQAARSPTIPGLSLLDGLCRGGSVPGTRRHLAPTPSTPRCSRPARLTRRLAVKKRSGDCRGVPIHTVQRTSTLDAAVADQLVSTASSSAAISSSIRQHGARVVTTAGTRRFDHSKIDGRLQQYAGAGREVCRSRQYDGLGIGRDYIGTTTRAGRTAGIPTRFGRHAAFRWRIDQNLPRRASDRVVGFSLRLRPYYRP